MHCGVIIGIKFTEKKAKKKTKKKQIGFGCLHAAPNCDVINKQKQTTGTIKLRSRLVFQIPHTYVWHSELKPRDSICVVGTCCACEMAMVFFFGY